MNNYEITILTKEETTETQIKEIEKAIAKEAKIVKFDDEGIKRLCYMIDGREKAHYLFYVVETDNNGANKLNDILYANENSLRHIVCKEILRSKK